MNGVGQPVMPRSSRVRPSPDGALWQPTSLALAALVSIGLGVAVLEGLGRAVPPRLKAVTAASDPRTTSILLEATEPVAYVVSRPDPLTLAVEMRHVTIAGVANRIHGSHDPVQAVSIDVSSDLGASLARVRIKLYRPTTYRVHSRRNLIQIDLDRHAATTSGPPAAEPLDRPARRSADPATEPKGADTGGDREDAVGRLLQSLETSPAGVSNPSMTIIAQGMQPAAVGSRSSTAPSSGPAQAPPASQPQQQRPPTTPPAIPAPSPAQVAPASQTPAPEPLPAMAGRAGEKVYTGHPISLDFQGADLRAVLRTFAEISGLNIVIDPTVQGTVDVALRDVPWDQALDMILRANKLGYLVDGTIVRIAPLTVLAEEEAQRRKLAEEQALSGELRVLTKALSYARAEEVAPLITKSALTARGTVQVDPRTNTLIMSDLPTALTTANDLIGVLDKPQPQVEIEARIVQTSREFARALGVQWGFNARAAQDLGNTTPLAFPNQGSVTGRTGAVQGSPQGVGTDSVPSAVNLPVSGASSAVGLSLGSVNGALNLDLALSALERSGQGRILSTPRVTTQNNIEAEITQGVQIAYQTVANNTVTVQFKDAALTLKVTPQITSANTVIMKISVENASPDFSRSIGGIPPIDTQRANTQVLVSDGQTTVIGGIYVSREQAVNDRTPGLHRIPFFGWLFKRHNSTENSTELLIFITPRVLKL